MTELDLFLDWYSNNAPDERDASSYDMALAAWMARRDLVKPVADVMDHEGLIYAELRQPITLTAGTVLYAINQ